MTSWFWLISSSERRLRLRHNHKDWEDFEDLAVTCAAVTLHSWIHSGCILSEAEHRSLAIGWQQDGSVVP
jgi:hypothetical protein